MNADLDNAQRLEQQMQELFARAKLPTSPAIASRILELIDRPDSTARDFAQLIEADPALAGRLLKMANSAQYAQRNPVGTIQRAITVLGNRQLRVIVLGFELVGHLDQLGSSSFDLPTFWQHSVLRACVARAIAGRIVPELDGEAFLIGLLADAGMLPLVQVLGEDYANLLDERLSPSALHLAETSRFPFTHCDAIAVLARMWRLPELIAAPLAAHHDAVRLGERSTNEARLAGIAYFAGAITFGRDVSRVPADGKLLDYARRELGIQEVELRGCFAAAIQAFAGVAPMIQEGMAAAGDVTQLLADANRHLMEDACANASRAQAIEADRDRILDEHHTLRTALGQYREQAARDPLTGLLNRRALLDSIDELSAQHARTLTLMFLDIDNFKPYNDCFGHDVGDAVLKMVADTVRLNAGDDGLSGRYGGEEFIAVLKDLSEPQAREATGRMVREVRNAGIPAVELSGPVTASVGAVWCRVDEAPSLQDLIGIADELMYAAKRCGKDRACYRSLDAPDAVLTIGGENEDDDAPAHTLGIPPAVFKEVAERLDAAVTAGNEPDLRKQQRRTAHCPCTVSYFFPPSRRMLRSGGFLRSISTGGLGLLSGRALMRGDLVEIELERDGKTVYAAGLVAFSRQVEGPIHEVGVQLFQTASQPVLSDDPERALRDIEWAAEAIEAASMTRRVA